MIISLMYVMGIERWLAYDRCSLLRTFRSLEKLKRFVEREGASDMREEDADGKVLVGTMCEDSPRG